MAASLCQQFLIVTKEGRTDPDVEHLVKLVRRKQRPDTPLQRFVLFSRAPRPLESLVHLPGELGDFLRAVVHDLQSGLFILFALEKPPGARAERLAKRQETALALQPQL